jgi:hypothetical protein
MAISNTALRVAELDFFKIKDNLKNFLRSQTQFNDYDFEGSGMSVLLDVLAYNTYYNSFYMNMAASEAFLDTAQVRSNILSHAKLINYVPESAQGALAKINVVVTPSTSEDSTPNVISLDRYSRLIGRDIDGKNFTFVTLNSNTAAKVNGSFTFANVMIKQGEVITYEFTAAANNVTRRYQIPSSNVDMTTITVTVQESSANTYTTEYKHADDMTVLTKDSRVYYLEEDDQLKYSLYFGDDILGKRPTDGNIIIVTYLDTLGSVSNNISKFVFAESIADRYRDNVRITTVQGSYGGVDKENIESIRFRAPYFYTAQNRCVTINDYESLIMKDYNNIDSVAIWGGEDNDPVVYGKVYLSLKTKNFYALSNLEKEKIKTSLIKNRNVLTIIPEIVDPDYVYLMIRGRVKYNPSLTYKSANEIQDIVKEAVVRYSDQELSKFKSTFKKSKLQAYIEASDPSITGSDIYVFMQKRVPININQTKNYYIKFNAPLTKGDYVKKLYTYPELSVLDSGNVIRQVFFEEVPSSFTGIDAIQVVSGGINYESTPIITIQGDGTGATAVAEMAGNRVKSIKVTNKGVNYSRATVLISGGGGSEAYALPVLQARNGTIRSFYYKTNGEKVVVNENAGTVNYNTGEVVLTALNPLNVTKNEYYGTDILTLNSVPFEDIIVPQRNRILSIDENNIQSIQLEIIAET